MDGKKGNIVNSVVAKLEADRRARRQQLERLAEQQSVEEIPSAIDQSTFAGSGDHATFKEPRSTDSGHPLAAGSSSGSSGMHSGSASPTAVAIGNGFATTTTIITTQVQQSSISHKQQYSAKQNGNNFQGNTPVVSEPASNAPAPVRPLRSKPVAETVDIKHQPQSSSVYPPNSSTISVPSDVVPRHLSSSSSSSYMEHDQESFAGEELTSNNLNSNTYPRNNNSTTPLPARDVVQNISLNADKTSHSSLTSFGHESANSSSFSSSRPPIPPAKPPAQGRFNVTNVIAKQQQQSNAGSDKIISVRNAEEKGGASDYDKPEYVSNTMPSSSNGITARTNDFADKTRQMRLTQPIGLQALPYQIQRKVVNSGFRFNVLIIGETGLGKSTLLESLFNQEFDRGERVDMSGGPVQPRDNNSAGGSVDDNSSLHLEKFQFNLREGEVHLQLTCYETKNFGDQIDSSSSFDGIVRFIDKHYEAYLTEECRIERCMDNVEDTRIHLCVYLLPPTGRILRQLDLQCLQALNDKLNIVPVIARADTFTADEVQLFKAAILQQLHTHGIHYMRFPLDWKEVKEDNITFDNVIPFAVVGSRTLEENEHGRAKRVRRLPYGTIDIENLQHNDFKHLRDAILRVNTDYLIETTHSRHYEHFRQRKIQEIGLSVAKLKSEQLSNNNANSNRSQQAGLPSKPKAFIDVDLAKRFVMIDNPDSDDATAAANNRWMIPTFVGVLINAVNYIDTPIQQVHLKSELEERWRPRAAMVEQEMMQKKRKSDEEYRQCEVECNARRSALEQKRQTLEYEMQRLIEIRESTAVGGNTQHNSSNGSNKNSPPHGNGTKASTLKIGGMGKKWRISNQ